VHGRRNPTSQCRRIGSATTAGQETIRCPGWRCGGTAQAILAVAPAFGREDDDTAAIVPAIRFLHRCAIGPTTATAIAGGRRLRAPPFGERNRINAAAPPPP